MKMFIYALAATAIANIAPRVASAADLDDGYEERETFIEERPVVVEHERIIERHYYPKPRYYEDETYYEPRYRKSFYGSDYRFGHRFH